MQCKYIIKQNNEINIHEPNTIIKSRMLSISLYYLRTPPCTIPFSAVHHHHVFCVYCFIAFIYSFTTYINIPKSMVFQLQVMTMKSK